MHDDEVIHGDEVIHACDEVILRAIIARCAEEGGLYRCSLTTLCGSISVALLLYPTLGLALSEYKQSRS